MLRFPRWTAALPFSAVLVVGCTERIAARPSPPDIAQVCAGVSEAQARTFLTDLRADLERVETVREPMKTKPFAVHTVGADVYVRATPGMTAEWLARVAQCHLAREAIGAPTDRASSPFGMAETTIDVSSTATGFVVAIRSADFVTAQEIARRAAALPAPS